MKKENIELNGRKIEVEVASNIFERMKGLSFREEGKMLFKFPQKVRSGLDMVFLSVPLQMIFIGSNREVLEVQRAEPWTLNPRTWKIYRPKKPYKYVLESSEFLEVSPRDKIDFL